MNGICCKFITNWIQSQYLTFGEVGMATITLHRFTVYDINSDESRKSRRWGTAEGIERVRGSVIPGTATEVDDSVPLDGGLTERGFEPQQWNTSKPAQFPNSVRA